MESCVCGRCIDAPRDEIDHMGSETAQTASKSGLTHVVHNLKRYVKF
jgi:hypothetical protein